VTDFQGVNGCECGAPAGALGTCAEYYHAVLAEEQADAEMYRWHAPVVCAYILQHPSGASTRYLDNQYRILQLYLDKGLDALLSLARHQVARNNHKAHSVYDVAPLESYAPRRPGGSPKQFSTTFSQLPCRDGSFVFDGHTAYGRRITAIVESTVEGWASMPT
jgi:hypothetical protein